MQQVSDMANEELEGAFYWQALSYHAIFHLQGVTVGDSHIGYRSREGQMDYFNDQYNFLFSSLDFSK